MEDMHHIKLLFLEKKLTNKWLAEQLQKNLATVSKWCTNKLQSGLQTLLELSIF